MYSPYAQTPSPAEFQGINNPFVTDPSHPRARFPDVSPQEPSYAPSSASTTAAAVAAYSAPSSASAWPTSAQPAVYSQPAQPYSSVHGYSSVGGGAGYLAQQLSPSAHLQAQQQPQHPQHPQQSQAFLQQPQQPTGFYNQSPDGQVYLTSPSYLQTYPSPVAVSPAAVAGQPTGVFAGQQQQQQQQQQPQQQLLTGYSYPQQTGYYQQQQPQQQPQQPTDQLPSYLASFDPYSGIGQNWNGSNASHPSSSTVSSPTARLQIGTTVTGVVSSGGGGAAPPGQQHPREYIRLHKAEIESWDEYAWKQLLGSFEVLREAWEGRRTELAAQAQKQIQFGHYGAQELQALLKEAESHAQLVAAATFQMKEVFLGYRASGDPASKRRVRESCNAALNGLPDWPPGPLV